MDGHRFDELVRLAGSSWSRRSLLRGLLGAIAAGAAVTIGGNLSAHARTCNTAGRACREHADCCSRNCLGPNRNGRRLCAATPPTNSCKPAGGTCTLDGNCCDRPCYQGTCRFVPIGQLCTADKDCSSNSCHPEDDGSYCSPNTPGGACRVAADCTTNLCTSGHCACATAGATCTSAADCCDRPCDANTGTCRFLPFDQLCASDAECSSNNCQQVDPAFKACVKNGAGGFCRENLDCLSGQCSGTTCA